MYGVVGGGMQRKGTYALWSRFSPPCLAPLRPRRRAAQPAAAELASGGPTAAKLIKGFDWEFKNLRLIEVL